MEIEGALKCVLKVPDIVRLCSVDGHEGVNDKEGGLPVFIFRLFMSFIFSYFCTVFYLYTMVGREISL